MVDKPVLWSSSAPLTSHSNSMTNMLQLNQLQHVRHRVTVRCERCRAAPEIWLVNQCALFVIQSINI